MTKTIFVATIGTRDLSFQISSGEWFNLGDDQSKEGEISEQMEVFGDLSLPDTTTHRELTRFLAEHWEDYGDRICPIILGKIFEDHGEKIKEIYLIGTDQGESIPQRSKDTRYSCELLKLWLEKHHSHIQTKVILIGEDGTNPTDFEKMFVWWSKTWKNAIAVGPKDTLWASLKGGVGQTSEAARIAALGLYDDQVKFFDVPQPNQQNRQGIPSEYIGPSDGVQYLENLKKQKAKQLLERYDYNGIDDILGNWLKEPERGGEPYLVAAQRWNEAKILKFRDQVPSDLKKKFTNQWFWEGYEIAYLAWIRYQQGNYSEAMFHSFRAVEGALGRCLLHHYPKDLQKPSKEGQAFIVLASLYMLPQFEHLRPSQQSQRNNSKEKVKLYGLVLIDIFKAHKDKQALYPDTKKEIDSMVHFVKDLANERNSLFHQWKGLEEEDLLKIWKANDALHWQQRFCRLLNFITDQSFSRLKDASLMPQIHQKLSQLIEDGGV